MSVTESDVRRAIAGARTMVVKVGSSSLTQPSGHLDVKKLNSLVAALSAASAQGARVVLVSSGAIAAGFGPLGFESRPSDVATQQAVAAVGQGLLMAQYEAAFGRFGVRVGQILITAEDTIRAVQYRNVQRTLNRLLELGVVPIVNENDSLASNEIRSATTTGFRHWWQTSSGLMRWCCSRMWTACIQLRRARRAPAASALCRM